MIQIPKELLAEDMLNYQGADLVLLFPVYETEIKNGEQVDKVRLVNDGRTHYLALNICCTPSRTQRVAIYKELLLVLMHILATLDWTYYHVDEIRAF